jgi:16S rRNA (guanine966-N2)-methyltransferase
MRIIAGKYRSRVLKSVEGQNTRPTLDKVKEATFMRLSPMIEESAVLDLFAGTGAIGLEALSRGAKHAVLVDGSKAAIAVIHANVETLKAQDQCTVLRMEALDACRYLANHGFQFDLVYLDPPYGKVEIGPILERLVEFKLLLPEAIVIHETLAKTEPILNSGLTYTQTYTYGTVCLHHYRRTP